MIPIPETEDPSQRLQRYYQRKESNWTESSNQRYNRKKKRKEKQPSELETFIDWAKVTTFQEKINKKAPPGSPAIQDGEKFIKSGGRGIKIH